MSDPTAITTLFLDIGGVLLTNGWDHHSRRAAMDKFGLDREDVNERHHLTFDTYEEGKISLDEYLDRVVFFEDRAFSRADFKGFMYSRSQPLQDMIDFTRELVAKHNLRTVAVSNEGKELNEYRIATFGLTSLINAFISSCYVHLRKPDVDMFRMALNISHASPDQVVYIDDRPMFVEVATALGIHGIRHCGLATTRTRLAEYGLTL